MADDIDDLARVRASRFLALIVGLDVPLIDATNQERNRKAAFDAAGCACAKIANPRDPILADAKSTQLVKFHGGFDDDESLMPTESGSFARLRFDSPLDVKVCADAMSRPVLFFGYSVQGLNLRLLLHRIWETWSRSAHERDRPRSCVFLPRAVLARWRITVLTSALPEPEAALTAFLEDLGGRVRALEPAAAK